MTVTNADRAALLWRTEKRLSNCDALLRKVWPSTTPRREKRPAMLALVDRALALHGPLKPSADNGLTRPICRRCSTNAWKNHRYPCATHQILERLRRELEK